MSQPTQDPTAPDVRASTSYSSPRPTTSSTSGAAASDRGVTDDQSPAEAFKDLSTRFGEIGEYLSYWLAAKSDGVKLTIRNVGVMAAVGIVGAVAGGAFVASAIVLLCVGIAHGLGAVFGGRMWLGDIVAAVLFLALLGGGIWFGMNRLTKASRERTVKKYDARQQQQRARYGTDVHQRAANPSRPGGQ